MSPDGLGWAAEWTPALWLVEDKVPHRKDLSWCFVRVRRLLRNKYLTGLYACSRDSHQGGDKREALLWTPFSPEVSAVALAGWQWRETCSVCRHFNSCVCCLTSGQHVEVWWCYFCSQRQKNQGFSEALWLFIFNAFIMCFNKEWKKHWFSLSPPSHHKYP